MAVMIGLGEVLWDVYPDRKLLGGAPANFAFHARQLGHDGIIVSRVGRDPLGQEILDRLAGQGMPTDCIQIDPDHPTGTVQVTLAADGSPRFAITPDVAWDHLAAEPGLIDLMRQADVVCFGTLAQRSPRSRETIAALLAAVDGTKVFDINLRQAYWSRDLIEAGLRQCQVVKLNEEELEVLKREGLAPWKGEPLSVCRNLLMTYNLRLLALTRAARGAMLVSADEVVDYPGIRVEVVDGVGAGDAFTAAMAHALLKGKPLTEVAGLANRVGAYVATQPGAMPPLPAEFREP